jgi:DNA polymerase III gamma/tau subunit
MKAREIIDGIAEKDSWGHAYLFIGGDESEHRQIRDNIVQLRHCNLADLSELKPEGESGRAGEIKAEEIRGLIHDLSLSPQGNCRIATIYGAEKLNLSAANILLKTLEEPPARAMILLFASTDSLLATIKSRCQAIYLPRYLKGGEMGIQTFLRRPFYEISKEIETIAKENKSEEVLDSMLSFLHEKMVAEKSAKCVRLIKRLEKIRKQIRANANPRLALESLVLLIREMVKI